MRSLLSRLLASRSQIKFILRMGLMLAIGIVGVVVLSILSRAMADITRSDETAAIFNVAADLEEDLVEAVQWLPDVEGLPRELPTIAREEITDTWLRAWSQPLILSNGSGPVGSSLNGDAIDGVQIYFDNSGQRAMLDGAEGWLGLPVHQIGHDLRLNFFSDDGSVAGITAESTRVLRAMPVDGGIEWFDAIESFEAVLVLREGNWRIHHMVRTASSGDWIAAPGPIPLSFDYDDVRSITWRASGQSAAEYWSAPDVDALEADLETIIDLGFNAIRIELPFDELGGREVTDEALEALESTLDAADEAGLNVTLSLLGGRTEHQPWHWDADDDQITAVARAVGNHPALVLWELAHAPDLDIGTERVDATMLNAWLIHISRTLRLADPDTPMTIGWADARAAAEAPPIADVVSFLYPGNAAGVTDGIAEIRDVFGAGPIMIADAAGTTHLSLFPGGMTDSEQARYFADLLQATNNADLVGFNVSSLRDFDVDTVAARAQDEVEAEAAAKTAERAALAEKFPGVPTPEPNEVGPVEVPAPILAEVTWPVGAEAGNGLVRLDGTPKPAAAVFLPGADLAAVPAAGLLEKVTKPFNMVLLALVILPLGGWFVLSVWDKRGLPLPAFGSAKTNSSTPRIKRILNRERFAMTAQAPEPQAPGAATPTPEATDGSVGDSETSSKPASRAARFSRWANTPVNDPRIEPGAELSASELTEPASATTDAAPALQVVPPLAAAPLDAPPVTVPTGPPPANQPATTAKPKASRLRSIFRSKPDPSAPEPIPGQPQLETSLPATTPQTAVPETAVPQTAVSQTAVPQTAVSQTAASQPAVSQPAVSQPAASQPATAQPVVAAPANHTVVTQPLAEAPVSQPAFPTPAQESLAPAAGPQVNVGLPQTTSVGAAVAPASAGTLTLLEVDLEAIDRVARSGHFPVHGDYATFLIRAFCIATKEFASYTKPDIAVEVVRRDPGTRHVIARANEMRLQALAHTLTEPPAAVEAAINARLELSTGDVSGITMSAGDGTVPTVCLVRLGERPVTITDSFGLPAIAVHSVGLLSVSAAAAPAQADQFLARLRDIIETRDWTTETD